jgi:hypothetical protein
VIADGEFEDMPRRRQLHQARWSPVMSNFLLTYLVGEIKVGHKSSNGFKAIALNNAAGFVCQTFGKTVKVVGLFFIQIQIHF